MIKYLTERLRQYTLNEEQSNSKVKESDHDSGAESDDQNPTMESEECSGSSRSRRGVNNDSGDVIASPTSSPYFLDSALPSDCDLTYDHHSSEEELEVINSSVVSRRGAGTSNGGVSGGAGRRSKDVIRCRSVSSVLPEKRKWSDAMDSESAAGVSELSSLCHRSRLRISSRRQQSSSDENMYATEGAGGIDRDGGGPANSHKFVSGCSSGASSDDETTPSGAFAPIAPSTPVNFSRSPPLNAHKPPTLRSLSPPLKMLNCDSTSVEQQQQQRSQVISPRYKRHRLTPTQRGQHAHNIQRPCLDFEKMQQMKENAVTTWRHHSNGEHGGELSLYCW